MPARKQDTTHPSNPELLSRREAILRVSALLGGVALVGGKALLTARSATAEDRHTDLFDAAQVAWLDEVADTILPETGTPGAKAAGVGPFIALMVTDTYSRDEQAVFLAGMKTLEAECQAAAGTGFMAAKPQQRLALLERIDREQKQYMDSKPNDAPAHYFRMLKELTLLGYFTSEIGCTRAQRYVERPGRFEPCVPYAPGDRAWARHA